MGAAQSDGSSDGGGAGDTFGLNRCCTPGQGKADVTTEPKADPNRIWTEEQAKIAGPIVAIAVHHGHAVHAEALEQMQISEINRLIEEDPYTGELAFVGHFRAVATHSRFEVDLNRTRDKCVYTTPADSWNLKVWKDETKGPSDAVRAKCLAYYDAFFARLRGVCERLEAEYGAFVLLDLHSYNHRRGGATAKADDPLKNPDINVGTSNMDRKHWAPLVDRFIRELQAAQTYSKSSVTDFPGGKADVRENVRFAGGAICRWIHANFPRSGCALALEFKKFWMDEWSGAKDQLLLDELGKALQATVPGLMEEIAKVGRANRDAANANAAAANAADAKAPAPAPAASAAAATAATPAPVPAAAPAAGAGASAGAASVAPLVTVTAAAPSAASIVISAPTTSTPGGGAAADATATAATKADAQPQQPTPATVLAVLDPSVAPAAAAAAAATATAAAAAAAAAAPADATR